MQDFQPDPPSALKIGAVARLTGVSVHTLRKWEDRYGAVEPHRTEGGKRIYSRTDLERLGLIKRLADAGLSLPGIARLPLADLEKQWQEVSSSGAAHAGGRPAAKVRVAVVGDSLAAVLPRRGNPSRLLNVVASAGSVDRLDASLGETSLDVLVLDCPTIQPATQQTVSATLERLGLGAALLVYRFGAKADLAALQAAGIATLRGPADLPELERAIVELAQRSGARTQPPDAPPDSDEDIPPPRLGPDLIARIARSAPQVNCECPRHLAEIIISLRAFEQYSAECEDRNPEDEELHHYLWRCAAMARNLFEDAIERVARAEGISLEP